MGVLKRQRERLRAARHDHQVYMIGHEAVGEKREFVKLYITPKKLEVHEAFRVGNQ